MYEEKSRRSIQINWKSLLIKLGILLVVIFLIIWIVSLFNNDDVPSNFDQNMQSMRNAAIEYFTGSKLPSEVNGTNYISLQEMFDQNLLIEFQDENGNDCDTQNSYAEITKISDEDYRIEVKLVCPNESDTIINTVQYQSQDGTIDEEPNDEDPVTPEEPNDNSGDTVSSGNSGSSNNQGNTTVNRPSNNGGSSSNNNNNNNSSNNNNNSNNSNNNGNVANACTYGRKEYSTTYPLAYVISGNCALGLSDFVKLHNNAATEIGVDEYVKLSKEMQTLEKQTGADISVSSPDYIKVVNKAGKGYVGYQIYFEAKQKISTYSKKTIYAYYLDTNGNRKVVIDNRSSLSKDDNNTGTGDNNTIDVASITLNRSSLTLDIGETYTFIATVNPSNATNKKVTWSSSNGSIASVSNGKVTARSAGTVTITAKAGNKTASARVTVLEDEIDVTRVTINKSSFTLDIGETYTLRATVTPSNATNKKVTWSSSNSNIASVSSSGRVTAKRAGTVTITAKAGNKSDTVKVTVLEEDYCRTNTVRVYSIGYISSSTIDDRYSYNDSYTVVYDDLEDIEVIDIDYGIVTGNNEYLKAYNYWKNNQDLTYYGSSNGHKIDPGSYTNLKNSSLKSNNFSVYVNYVKESRGQHYLTIYRNLYNLSSIGNANSYKGVYYLPLYIDITYNNCD